MWLLNSPKNNSEFHKKIAWTSFILVLLGMLFFTPQTYRFALFMNKISFGVKFSAAFFTFYLADLYLPLVLLLSELIFKLHKRVSALFSLRFQFEKNYIIGKFLRRLKMYPKLKNFNKRNRKEVVDTVYNKYRDPDAPAIDKKLIVKSLGAWSWFWVVVNLLLAMFIVGLTILIVRYTFLKLLIILGGLLLLYILAYILYIFPCKIYAAKQVEAILKKDDRMKDINRYLTTALVKLRKR